MRQGRTAFFWGLALIFLLSLPIWAQPSKEAGVHVVDGQLYGPDRELLLLRGTNDSWQLCAFFNARGGYVGVSGTGPVEYSGRINTSDEYAMANYWYRYARTLQALHPSLNFVRIGAHAAEGTGAIWTCYNADRAHYDRVLSCMAEGFEAAGFYFVVTLSGFADMVAEPANRPLLKSQTLPQQYVGRFPRYGGDPYNNILHIDSESFDNLCELAAYTGDHLAGYSHFVGIEFCNEPDLHFYDSAYWRPVHGDNNNMNGSKHNAFKAWSARLASKTKELRHHEWLMLNGETFANVNPDYKYATVWDYNSGDISRAAKFIASLSEGMDIVQTHIYSFDCKYCDNGCQKCPCDCGWRKLSSALVEQAQSGENKRPAMSDEWGRWCGAWQVWDFVQAREMEQEGLHHACILPPGGRPVLGTQVSLDRGSR